ncbi:hypothetical protein SAMN05216389_101114 [Oceanobacillus limi]|uniref:Uncharacterized protein n=1 Tax=Oceanobacillus limi TaxID=930131 RepID=A0A1H9Y139_9BACI|nr:hypothetical protein [Oceanobacillus limi]SES62493.1 hypothetical protein SAMN05216389_101114 [Oceanobacillus limi]
MDCAGLQNKACIYIYSKRGGIINKTGMLNPIKKFILDKTRLLKIEELKLPDQAIEEFDKMFIRYISSGDGSIFTYNSRYPLYMFLNYVIENKGVLIHGSNNSSINKFEPRNSSLFNGKPIKAVFASSDGIWSLFFAVQNRKGYIGSIRNMCLSVTTNKGKKRYYYFSTNNIAPNSWTNGTIYFFTKNLFKQGGIRDEWVCERELEPLARLTVTPSDFPFLDKVRVHRETESLAKTIIKALLFKM